VFRIWSGRRSGKPTLNSRLSAGKQRGCTISGCPTTIRPEPPVCPLPPDQLVRRKMPPGPDHRDDRAESSLERESDSGDGDDARTGRIMWMPRAPVALAVGPYVRRKTVISDRYDQLSLLRTIGLLLGLYPLSPERRPGGPMFTLFTESGFPAPSHCLSPLPISPSRIAYGFNRVIVRGSPCGCPGHHKGCPYRIWTPTRGVPTDLDTHKRCPYRILDTHQGGVPTKGFEPDRHGFKRWKGSRSSLGRGSERNSLVRL